MRRAVDANPKDPNARLDLAQLLIQLGRPAQAKPVIDELVRQEPNNMNALDAQFRVAAATDDTAAAKAAADAMVGLQPKAEIGYVYQGMVSETEKRLDDAVHHYSTALEMQPDASDALKGLTRALVGLKRTTEALKRLDEVSARFPKLPFAPNIKGELMLETHQAPDAEAAFRTAIEREPKWRTSYQNLALAQVQENDLSGAVATLQAAILQADNPESLRLELGSVFERMGKSEDAIQAYDAALRKDPHADIAANNLAMLLITYKKDQPSLDRAKELAQRFAKSTNASYLDTYGWVLYKRGESAAAVAALQSVVLKTPDSPASLYHLGMAQASAGLSDAARQSLARSLKSGKSFPGMDEAKATLDKLAKLAPVSPAPRS
jgi:tetratricopeptide (TPR) repeat protein